MVLATDASPGGMRQRQGDRTDRLFASLQVEPGLFSTHRATWMDVAGSKRVLRNGQNSNVVRHIEFDVHKKNKQ